MRWDHAAPVAAPNEVTAMLREYGNNNWELVAVLPGSPCNAAAATPHCNTYTQFFFKRAAQGHEDKPNKFAAETPARPAAKKKGKP